MLFLLFAESRQLVPRDQPIYSAAYAVTTLCRTRGRRRRGAGGLWESLAAVTRLSRAAAAPTISSSGRSTAGCSPGARRPSLEAPARSRVARARRRSRDQAIRDALVALGTRPGPRRPRGDRVRRPRRGATRRGLRTRARSRPGGRRAHAGAGDSIERRTPGDNERNTSGAHRARNENRRGPSTRRRSLAEFVVRRTLGPLVAGASADAILALRVVDPAMGSGAFLVAACRYLAAAYERALVEEGRCAEPDLDADARADMRRLIAEHCLAGVDVNPVAVQLARLSLVAHDARARQAAGLSRSSAARPATA